MFNPVAQKYFRNKKLEKYNKIEDNTVFDSGINIIGYVNSNFGLANSCRCFISALQNTNININLIEKSITQKSKENYYSINGCSNFNVNIHSYNPNLTSFKNLFENRYNIGIWFFELEFLPESWKEEAKNYDEIWATSSFLEQIFLKELPDKKIRRINHPLPSIQKLDKNISKSYFNLSPDDFVCLFIFDFDSDVNRKNPLAVVQSFQQAFVDNANAKLIIKSHSGNSSQIKKIDLAIGSDKRIFHYSDNWPHDNINVLLNSCDVYISLHRSEGVGLTLLEAIALEKPTLSTNYSGNLDFCKKEWAELVDFEMVEVNKDSAYYNFYGLKDQDIKWAEANIKDASEKLKKIYDNYLVYEEKAKEGSKWVLENYSISKIGGEIENLFNQELANKN
jgi:glycosyltransferase involved in cell wall biosynthesis